MFHSGTQTLIDLWSRLPRSGRAPDRSAFDPVSLGLALPRAFLLEPTPGGLSLRLAGGWIERLHDRPLKGVRWLDLWAQDSRILVHRSATQAVHEARPVVILAQAGLRLEPIEVVIAPLGTDRLLGLYQPTTAAGADLREIVTLNARMAAPAAIPARPAPVLAALDGRRIA